MVYNSVLQGTCLESISSDADINKTGFGQFVIKEEKWVSRVHTVSPTKWVKVTMKLEYGCFVAALCLLKFIDDDNEWKMRMSPSWLLRLYPQLDYYKLWQQQYAVWMHDAVTGFDKCVPVQIMREADSRNTFCSEAILWLSILSTLRGQNIMFCKYLLCNLIKKC